MLERRGSFCLKWRMRICSPPSGQVFAFCSFLKASQPLKAFQEAKRPVYTLETSLNCCVVLRTLVSLAAGVHRSAHRRYSAREAPVKRCSSREIAFRSRLRS